MNHLNGYLPEWRNVILRSKEVIQMPNSKAAMLHNTTIYNLMDMQVVDHEVEEILARRVAGDRPEAAVLNALAGVASFAPGKLGRQIRTYVRWLLEHDQRENADHDDAMLRARERRLAERKVCRLLEFPNGNAPAVKSKGA